MNKSLIALAVAAAVAVPGVASAEAVLYGKARVSVGFFDNGGDDVTSAQAATGAAAGGSSFAVTSHGSRVGVKGSEDLGGGLKGKYQIEFAVDLAEGSGGLSGRNQWVGVAGEFGEVRIGRHDTPYKIATNAFAVKGFGSNDTPADYNNLIRQGDNRTRNTIAYIGTFGPVTAAAAYVADVRSGGDEPGAYSVVNGTNVEDDANNKDAFSLMAAGSFGDFSGSVAYEQHNEALTADDDLSMFKISGAYTFGDAMVGAIYEMVDAETDAFDGGYSNVMVGGSYKVGKGKVMAYYGMRGETEDGTDDGGAIYAAGYFHNFSKRTQAYGLITGAQNDEFGSLDLGKGGLGGYGVDPSNGESEDTMWIGVGVNHKF